MFAEVVIFPRYLPRSHCLALVSDFVQTVVVLVAALAAVSVAAVMRRISRCIIARL